MVCYITFRLSVQQSVLVIHGHLRLVMGLGLCRPRQSALDELKTHLFSCALNTIEPFVCLCFQGHPQQLNALLILAVPLVPSYGQ
jgi:hypothetical protein